MSIKVDSGLKAEPVAVRMMTVFEGHPGVHGYHGEPELDSGGLKWGIKSTAHTVRSPVTLPLWEKHLNGEQPLGVVPIRPDNTCLWGSIDYDKYDEDLLEIIKAVKANKLPLVPCRSKSGGLHLFLFMLDAQPAGAVQTILRELAAQLGAAGSEIFPKQTRILTDRGDLGNWMVMPYFGGDYGGKLRKQVGLLPTGSEIPIEDFLALAEENRLTDEQFKDLIENRRKRGRPSRKPQAQFANGPPCLEHMAIDGFPEGGRNNALFMIGIYWKKCLPVEAQWKEAIRTQNQRFMKPPLEDHEVDQIIRQLEKKDYEYTCKIPPMVNHCDVVKCRRRQYGVGQHGAYPVITSLTKQPGEQPRWFVTIGEEGDRIECETEELYNYNKFNMLCLNVIDKCFLPVRQSDWNQMLQTALESLDTLEELPETKPGAELKELLEEWLTGRTVATRYEDIANGQPWYDEATDLYWITVVDFEKWMKTHNKKIVRGKVISFLKNIKKDYKEIFINRKHLNIWGIPRTTLNIHQRQQQRRDPV